MFSQVFTSLLLVSTFTAGAFSKPIPKSRPSAVSRRTSSTPYSFNNWGGISSMSGFDNFYGSGNFDGSQSFHQTIIEQKEVVCHSQTIEVIQQRLVVLQEMAKRIITEQVCEVETQTIVFEQFYSSLGGFSHDLRRQSGNAVGYDSGISSHYSSIVNSDGSLSSNDMGFSGSDIGGQTIVPSGNNWNDGSSPVSVGDAYNSAWNAYQSLHPNYVPSVSSSSSCSGSSCGSSVPPPCTDSSCDSSSSSSVPPPCTDSSCDSSSSSYVPPPCSGSSCDSSSSSSVPPPCSGSSCDSSSSVPPPCSGSSCDSSDISPSIPVDTSLPSPTDNSSASASAPVATATSS